MKILINKQCYNLRLKKQLTWNQISNIMSLSVGTVWYKAKIYAEKQNKTWPIHLNSICMAEKAYYYRKDGFSWWKISKLINRSMRLTKMYAKEWAKRNNTPWPIKEQI